MKFNSFGAFWRTIVLTLYFSVSLSLNAFDASPSGLPPTPPLTPAPSAQNSPSLKRRNGCDAIEQFMLPLPVVNDQAVSDTQHDNSSSSFKLMRVLATNKLSPQQNNKLKKAHKAGISSSKRTVEDISELLKQTELGPVEDLNAPDELDSMDQD